ncbi:MAG: hypothetical protein ABI833_06685, partial [Acidobacteriota bacterium]
SAGAAFVCWGLLASIEAQPRPQPGLAPGEVIRIVVEALHNRNTPAPNAGIFTVYQFASPANRAVTGPYGTFLRRVSHPGFAPLFSGHADGYGPVAVAGERAEQTIRFRVGEGVAWFRFVVSRQTSEQTEGRCTGCWMVDAVIPTRPKP